MRFRGPSRRGEVLGAVVALNGASRAELERATTATAKMADRSLLVAVDGGLRTCRAARRRPDLFVGDGDSAGSLPRGLRSILHPEDKDFSDLAGALAELRRLGVRVVGVAGLLGGRVDHEWANLLELGSRARAFAGFVAPTARGTVLVTAHGCGGPTARGRLLSLFALGATATVTLRGTRWELRRRRLRPGSHGLSNLTGARLDLTVHSGVVAVVFPKPRQKRGQIYFAAAK